MTNILSFIPALKPKGPHEWAGPCPLCGGATSDGFVVWPDRKNGGAYLCRKCGAHGDGIQLLRELHGMSYHDACRELGLASMARPSLSAKQVLTRAAAVPPAQRPVTPTPAAMPPSAWMESAAAFLTDCQRGLNDSPAAVCALGKRSLTPSTACAVGLGWNPADRYPMRTAWGLEAGQGKGKLVLPAGLVIATRRREGVASLTVRTVDPNRPKYWEVVGGMRGAAFAVGRAGLPVLLLESALDAVLAFQEAGDLCAAVAAMGNAKALDAAAASFIKAAPLIIAVPDNDDGGKAAWECWSQCFPSALRFTAVGHKDIGDMHSAALKLENVPTVREWVQAVTASATSTAAVRAA